MKLDKSGETTCKFCDCWTPMTDDYVEQGWCWLHPVTARTWQDHYCYQWRKKETE